MFDEDEKIVGLFLSRDDSAVEKCREKYGGYLSKIAYNILGDISDCEEALNDALFGAWRAIPPNEPKDLKTFLIKLTKRSAIDILRTKTREKRRATELSASLDELAEIIPAEGDPAKESELKALRDAIETWLSGQPEKRRRAFMLRYYFSEPLADIAGQLKLSETAVKSILFRLRKELRAYLEKEDLL